MYKYEIYTTTKFDNWLSKLKDNRAKAKILSRLDRIQLGNFGETNTIANKISELKIRDGKGYRIYYTIINHQGKAVFCLLGGNKSTQTNDINLVKRMIEPEVTKLFEELENEV